MPTSLPSLPILVDQAVTTVVPTPRGRSPPPRTLGVGGVWSMALFCTIIRGNLEPPFVLQSQKFSRRPRQSASYKLVEIIKFKITTMKKQERDANI